MEVDKIATIVGAVAACIAAWYGFKAPSKDDLKRVEDHLKTQNDQRALIDLGNRASLSVRGEGWTDDPMILNASMRTPGLPLVRFELVSGADLIISTVPCVKTADGEFQATINREMFGKWFAAGTLTDHARARIMYIRAIMDAQGRETSRKFGVIARQELAQAPTHQTYFNSVEGEC